MSGWLSYVLEVAVLVLSVSSMLSVGLGTALGEIMRRLRDAGALARFLIANFVLVPLLTLGILRLVPSMEPPCEAQPLTLVHSISWTSPSARPSKPLFTPSMM